MTKKKYISGGVHLHVKEAESIADWLRGDLMMQALTVKIVTSRSTGIGSTVMAYALDERGETIAEKNVTEYEEW